MLYVVEVTRAYLGSLDTVKVGTYILALDLGLLATLAVNWERLSKRKEAAAPTGKPRQADQKGDHC